MKHKLINFILFQSIWFILILAAAHESFYGLVIGLLLILVQYWHGKLITPDFKLILAAILVGFAHDTSLNYFRFIQYILILIHIIHQFGLLGYGYPLP